jgi:hypothetical protein
MKSGAFFFGGAIFLAGTVIKKSLKWPKYGAPADIRDTGRNMVDYRKSPNFDHQTKLRPPRQLFLSDQLTQHNSCEKNICCTHNVPN